MIYSYPMLGNVVGGELCWWRFWVGVDLCLPPEGIKESSTSKVPPTPFPRIIRLPNFWFQHIPWHMYYKPEIRFLQTGNQSRMWITTIFIMNRRQPHQQQHQRQCHIPQRQPMVKGEINSFMPLISFKGLKSLYCG